MASSPPPQLSQEKQSLTKIFSRRKSSKKPSDSVATPQADPQDLPATDDTPGDAGGVQASPSVHDGDVPDAVGAIAQPGEASSTSADQGQVPTSSPSSSTPPPPPSPPPAEEKAPTATHEPATATPPPPEPTHTDDADKDKDRDKDKGSLSTTVTGTQNHSQPRSSRRKVNKSFTSDGALTSSSNGDKTATVVSSHQPANKKSASSSARSRQSFLSKLVHKLIPCVPSSHHDLDIDDAASKTSDPTSSLVLKEKPPVKENEKDTRHAQDPPAAGEASSGASAPDASSSAPLITPPSVAIEPTAPPVDAEVILPPTPTKLLPQAETEGMTSGAVQPPGSTGEEVAHDQSRAHTHDSGDDSDGTSFTEEEEVEEGAPMDEAEDEEDRLIMNGGAGVPLGPDGTPRPLLPPIAPHHVGRKCLVLDLDETLVHSSFKSIQQADYVVPVEIEYHWHNVYVIKRPGVDNFLKKMGEIYEVVVFTASLSKYADPVLDKLDIHQVVSHRLFRESCYNHKGNYVKDLSQLGRPIADTIILDNSPASYIFHPNNAVPVSSWFNDPHDTELTDLCPFLADLGSVDDVRGVLDGGL